MNVISNQSIDGRIEALYGNPDWSTAAGCLHVAAIHGPSGCVIAIGPEAPRSATDRFVLGFARARARLILTTGTILRAEPDLEHRYAEDAKSEGDWREWRGRVLGEEGSPEILVLSGSGALDPSHVALERGRGVIYTTPDGCDRLGSPPEGFEIVVGESGEGAVQEAARYATARVAGGTVLIEAGPTTSGSLYPDLSAEQPNHAANPVGVDELLLSRFEGDLSPAAIGPAFVADGRISQRFGSPVSSVAVEESSGLWRFERFVARS